MKLSVILFYTLMICSLGFSQPTANFKLNKTKACVGDTIIMTSTSIAGSAPIVNYIWSAQGAIVEQGQGSG